ncbi:MAG: MgtC/SapB family protein [Patescibacteria group bacterium]|nr:MgtC/SapB family protein [Patescibacteria group bacterium]
MVWQLEPFFQLLLAAFLGALIGLEREAKRKEAGLRTFSLVSLGSCFFTAIAVYLSSHQGQVYSFIQIDPTRVIQAVAVGIGFIGSGLIIQRRAQIEGLTTAGALWATAAVGIGIGVKLYFLAIFGTVLIFLILTGLKWVENKLFSKSPETPEL